jgi:hypothetical protein
MTPSDVNCWRVPRSAGSTVCRRLRVAAILIGVAWAAVPANAEPTFEDRLNEINEAAKDARDSGKLETVEQKRRERWELIGEIAGQKNAPDSPWVEAYKAIEKVDGSESSTEEYTGLLNELKYKESCDVLKKAFDKMAENGNGALLGEVATRYFEVAQQAKGVYRDALIVGSPDQVADAAEIEMVLEVAAKRDPCCVSALAMLLYLQRPDPKEAFLRAEVRDSFKKRQKQLVELSHPLILPTASKRKASNQQNREPKPENEGVPVMPWHAAVELDKAVSLQYLLQDLDYAKPLTPDFTLVRDGVDMYTIPGHMFGGSDAQLSPCQLLYGQMLFARASDAAGRRRSVAYYLTAATKGGKKEFLWDYRYVDLLWRNPTEDELTKDPALRRKQDLISKYAARRKWRLGEQEFCLYDFPIREIERCLQEQLQVFCIRNIDDLEKLKFVPLRNNLEAVDNMQTSAERLAKTPFGTSWPVQSAIDAFKRANDPTKHPLTELMRPASRTLLVLVSERKPGSKLGDSEPNFFPANAAGDPPYIMLDEGRKLHFSVSGREESPCCQVEYDGATAYLPLTPKAIPRPILLGSEIGKAFVGLLKKAGYTEEQAVDEIERAMNERGDYLPEKFKKFMIARVNAMRAASLKTSPEQKRELESLSPWLKMFGDRTVQTATTAELSSAVARAMLAEEGWYGDTDLKPALNELFHEFGFRYLRDRRGNWIMPRRLIAASGRFGRLVMPAGETPAGTNKDKNAIDLSDYPLAYLAQDGKRAIDKGQIYSWTDYLQLKDSIFHEHLNKMVCFHPCLAAIEVIEADNRNLLTHPDLNDPSYMKGFMESEFDVSGSEGGGEKNASTSAIPTLSAPFPEWVVEGDKTQATSLSNLHAAYTKKLIAACSESREMTEISDLLRRIRELRTFAEETDREWLDKAYTSLITEYRRASTSQILAMQSILEVQLESGRNYARRNYFHKALVWYNDFLSQVYPDDESASKVLIFNEVPTTQTASLFVDNLQGLIEGQSLLINTQVELAGVLNASGLKSSAHFVWQRMIDDYEFFLKPSVAVAEELMESYGLRMSRRAENAVQTLESTVEMCRKAIKKYGLSVEWRNVEPQAGQAVAGMNMPRRKAADVRADLARDNAGDLSDAERERLERECDALNSDRSLDFTEWLEWKKVLIELRPLLAFRTSFFSPPWLACPCDYDADEGFADPSDAAQDLLRNVDSKSIVAWCAKPMEIANEDRVAVEASTLLGWYWLDVGRLPAARAAFMNLARVKGASAKRRPRTAEGLVDELHAYAAITAAGAIVESMPGLSAYKTDFAALLEGQLRNWEKRWFAQGAYGPHASQQRLELMARAAVVKSQLAKISRDWRGHRYFFPDYSFEYGAIPDYLAEMLYKSPDLFRALTAEEVKERGEEAVEGAKWRLISEADANKFLESRKMNGKIDEELVFLGK